MSSHLARFTAAVLRDKTVTELLEEIQEKDEEIQKKDQEIANLKERLERELAQLESAISLMRTIQERHLINITAAD